MADDLNISYSFQANSTDPHQVPKTQADDQLIAFTNCERVELGNGSTLLLNRDNGKQMAVAPEVVTALTYCTTFMTLQEHAQNLVDTIPQLQGQLADVTKVLKMVNDAGLMLPAQTISDRLCPDPVPTTQLAPTRACIITCDRPAALERLLDSMLRSGNLSRHDELFLVDDSRDPANGEKNRGLVAKFNLTSSKDMRYVGAAEQRQVLQQLIVALPEDEAAIRFLIDRERWAAKQSYGLSRTLCMLLSVGYRCIMLDDDVLCSSVLPPARQEGITFGGGSTRELTSYDSEQAMLQSAIYGDTDPVSGHARCLGMNLAEAITELDTDEVGPAALHNTNAAMLNTLQADSPILVTQCGSWGDPGTASTNWFYHLGKESIAPLLASPNGLQNAMQKRHYWLGRSRPNISKMAVMSQATGIDNTQLLPPYFPAFRGEDYLFASMVLYLHPKSAVLDYAWCVPHLPLEQRTGQGASDVIAARDGLTLCARYLADHVDYETRIPPRTRLKKLALLLQELSETQSASLLATFRTELAREHASQLQIISGQLQGAAALGSQDWEAYLRRGIEEVSSATQAPTTPTNMAGVPADLSEDELLQQTKSTMGEFSTSLTAWPAIRTAAAAISSQMLASGDFAP